MPVLYVGHYREASGWGQVTRDQIMSLLNVDVPVVARPINLGLATAEVPDAILEAEKGDPRECSVIVQHVLPHYMKYDSHFRKNIGMFELESTNIKHTQWVDHLNIMDELWVPCTDMMGEAYIKSDTIFIPHACDIKEYEKEYEPLAIQNVSGKFIFYFIGTFNRRKHLAALLRAFHTEFDPFEPVELVIKTNRSGTSPEELAEEVVGMCRQIKENLKLYHDLDRYAKEIIITVDLSREELLRLHHTCDCFVCPSFGEAWCAPAFDAMAMSNIVIAGKTGGPADYITSGVNGFLVNGSMEPIFGEHDAFPGFGTARELEFDISIADLQKTMRRAYHLDHVQRTDMATAAKREAAAYSYARVGEMMKEQLNA